MEGRKQWSNLWIEAAPEEEAIIEVEVIIKENGTKVSFFKFIYFIYLFLVVLGLRCCPQTFSSCSKQGLLFVGVCGLLIAVASPVVEQGL